MKPIITLLLLAFTASCQAKNQEAIRCSLTSIDARSKTITLANSANTFWQKDKDGYESIDRLHINFNDGSVAVIEHKYCSMYNFEIAYYSKSTSAFSDMSQLKKILFDLFAQAAVTDANTDKAIATMLDRLETKGFDPEQAIATTFDSTTEDNQRAEYSVSYQPIEDSSLHRAALLLYMGIGGEH